MPRALRPKPHAPCPMCWAQVEEIQRLEIANASLHAKLREATDHRDAVIQTHTPRPAWASLQQDYSAVFLALDKQKVTRTRDEVEALLQFADERELKVHKLTKKMAAVQKLVDFLDMEDLEKAGAEVVFPPPGKYFVGLGTHQGVPMYMRWMGKIRNLQLQKTDVDELMYDFWTERWASTSTVSRAKEGEQPASPKKQQDKTIQVVGGSRFVQVGPREAVGRKQVALWCEVSCAGQPHEGRSPRKHDAMRQWTCFGPHEKRREPSVLDPSTVAEQLADTCIRARVCANECHESYGKPPATATPPLWDSRPGAGSGLLFQGWSACAGGAGNELPIVRIGTGIPLSPTKLHHPHPPEGKGKRERIIVVVGSPCQENHPADAHTSAQVSAGVGKPSMDSECASGCTWSTARAAARLRDSRPWSSQNRTSHPGAPLTPKTSSDPQRVRMSSGESRQRQTT